MGDGEATGLVDRARRGDQAAWAELYRRAYPQLVAFAHHRLASADDARDAVSETMVRAVAQLERFNRDDDGFTPWLFGILRHVVVDTYRRRSRFAPEEPPEPVAVDADPADHVTGEADRAMLRAAFARLDDGEREVLALRFMSGLSSDEVAEALGKKPSAVRMAQMRALSRLRTFVEEAQRVG